jgi:hypothetical protein
MYQLEKRLYLENIRGKDDQVDPYISKQLLRQNACPKGNCIHGAKIKKKNSRNIKAGKREKTVKPYSDRYCVQK